jgi:uncharacterized SAM-binding protein YcdF (DUF218 family)
MKRGEMVSVDFLSDDDFENLLRPLWDYLVFNQPPEHADVIFVFGGIDLSVPRYAAYLSHKKYAPFILISGNAGSKTPNTAMKPEALIFKDEMVVNGVEEKRIFIEDKATNALENVTLGMHLLSKNNIQARKLLLTARPFMQRRCIATFKKQYPDVEVISCPPQGTILSFCLRTRKAFVERLIGEFQRLLDYSDKGDIIIDPIPELVIETVEVIKKYLDQG